MGDCAVRPLLRTQEGEISQPPALAAAVMAAVVDRRRQEASRQAEAEEVAEAELRPAKVRRRAAVPVLAEEASEEVGAARVEVEPLPVVTLAPELAQQLVARSRNLLSLIGFFRVLSFAARVDQNVAQTS
jgi:hypothetical protein